MHTAPLNHSRQQGAILVVSMMLLLMLTIIGVTAMNVVTIEERMAGNMRDSNIAFQGAEAALRDAEAFIAPLPVEPAKCTSVGSPCTSGIWEKDTLPDNMVFENLAWWQINGEQYGDNAIIELGSTDNDPLLGSIINDPFSIVEYQEFVRDSLTVGHAPPPTGRVFYRVTGWSQGGSAEAIAVLQTTFAKRFN